MIYSIHPWIIQTLNKWSTKIQAVAPSVLLPSNRNAFSKSQQHLKSAVQLAEETLRDHDKLLARSRIRRGKGIRLGASTAEAENDPDVFDDTDFYQQLLRDVIDSKGNGGGVDDWMAVQKEKKAKKKVDTRASKGRKIRSVCRFVRWKKAYYYRLGITYTKRCKTLWFLCPSWVRGTKNRLTSCLPRCLVEMSLRSLQGLGWLCLGSRCLASE